jgi:[amino group carrier protein]-lysine/ornithine hydrolase
VPPLRKRCGILGVVISLERYTDQERGFIDLLREAVTVQSLSTQEADVSRFFVRWMHRHGFKAEMDGAGSAVGIRGTGRTEVVLLGHMDTVPGEIPVRIEEQDGKLSLWGRGSVDAKGPLCTFLAAVSLLPPHVLERARFVCVGAVEEEAPSSKGAHHAISRFSPDYCIIGEPSGWDTITLGYKGRLVVKARLEKDNFHSAGNDTTASEDMLRYWNALQAWALEFNRNERIFDGVQVAMQGISSANDGLRQTSEATIGLRLPPRLGPDDAMRELERLRQEQGLERLRISYTGREEPYRGAKDTTLTRAFRVAMRSNGITPQLTLKTGTSDMNVVAPLWGCPIVAYGPGDSTLDHTPTEHLELDEYLSAIRVLRDALERLVI